MAPDIQQRIESDLFAGGKSMMLGAWLWMASVVSPSYVRDAINQLMETAKQPLEVLNQKIAAIEQQAQASVASIGAKVEFPRIPLDKLPSFDDIQNFQTILHQPEVYCSPAFKEAMMVDKLKPTVTLPQVELPQVPGLPQTGGKRRHKTRKHSKKVSRRSRRSRRLRLGGNA